MTMTLFIVFFTVLAGTVAKVQMNNVIILQDTKTTWLKNLYHKTKAKASRKDIRLAFICDFLLNIDAN